MSHEKALTIRKHVCYGTLCVQYSCTATVVGRKIRKPQIDLSCLLNASYCGVDVLRVKLRHWILIERMYLHYSKPVMNGRNGYPAGLLFREERGDSEIPISIIMITKG